MKFWPFAFAVLIALAPMSARAAEQQKPTPESLMLEARLTDVEADIGQLMQRRVDASAGVLRELELRIDVRIAARWLIAQAASAPAGSEQQASAWIHAADLLTAAALAEQEIDASSRSAPANSPSVRALHDWTFKMPDAKTAADLDTATKTAAAALLAVFGGDGGAARLPPMRPPAPKADDAASSGRRTVEQLVARAHTLNISPSLRAQLLAVCTAAVNVEKDPKQAAQLETMRAVLDDAVTLAEGLQTNTAVERDDRVKMESQVAQGLAMFLDTRTRALGQKRIAGLGRYRQMLTRLTEMKIAPDLMRKFTPTLLAAQRNPETGGPLMESIDQFLQEDARLATPAAGGGELTGLYAKASEEAKRRATSARDSFVEAASSTSSFRNPQVLRGRVELMRKALDARAAVTRTPETLKVLNTYRPKPFGGIDKRVQAALTTLMNDSLDSEREAATQFLAHLGRLADFATELNRPTSGPAPATIAAYTGKHLDSFHARRKAVVGEIANGTAAGHALDDAALAPLETARNLEAALDLASHAEQALAEADVLRRWVDWGVSQGDLDELLGPCRESTADALEGYVNSDARLLKQWDVQWKRYQPVLMLLARVASKTEFCRSLPAGRTGALAKLVTPLADQPFAVERSARLLLDTWSHHHEAKNDKSADAVLDALAARLQR